MKSGQMLQVEAIWKSAPLLCTGIVQLMINYALKATANNLDLPSTDSMFQEADYSNLYKSLEKVIIKVIHLQNR